MPNALSHQYDLFGVMTYWSATALQLFAIGLWSP